jgi:hypothetical protein
MLPTSTHGRHSRNSCCHGPGCAWVIRMATSCSFGSTQNNVPVACLCTWYWLADLCAQKGMPFVLGHALDMKAIHGGNAKNATIAAQHLAVLLRFRCTRHLASAPVSTRVCCSPVRSAPVCGNDVRARHGMSTLPGPSTPNTRTKTAHRGRLSLDHRARAARRPATVPVSPRQRTSGVNASCRLL